MKPKTHKNILNAICVVIVIIGLVSILADWEGVSDPSLLTNLICAPFLLFTTLGLLFIYLAPVRCGRKGCPGRMFPDWWFDRAKLQIGLFYRCGTCNETYETGFTIGLGQPW
jgi:hypothetical protein